MAVEAPGIYPDMASAAYHADPCPEPSASASILKTLMAKSPRHAALEHPRLEPNARETKRQDFDVGQAAHAILLGQPDPIRVIEADGYRTRVAKEERDAAYAAGQIPALREQYERVCAMVEAARAQIAAHQDAHDAFDLNAGDAELTLIWQDQGVWCRARLDFVHADRPAIDDFKTTATTALGWGDRTFWDTGCDIQAGFYRRAYRALYGRDPEVRFIVQEVQSPYGMMVYRVHGRAAEIADQRAERALRWWRWCIQHDRWPGYPALTADVQVPARQEYREEDEAIRQDNLAQAAPDMTQRFIDWQAPLTTAAE
mgnify:CR=1 FL=1